MWQLLQKVIRVITCNIYASQMCRNTNEMCIVRMSSRGIIRAAKLSKLQIHFICVGILWHINIHLPNCRRVHLWATSREISRLKFDNSIDPSDKTENHCTLLFSHLFTHDSCDTKHKNYPIHLCIRQRNITIHIKSQN